MTHSSLKQSAERKNLRSSSSNRWTIGHKKPLGALYIFIRKEETWPVILKG
nr:MAG TPA: hypothetical protein [Caudoviricetes sp.]DAO28686.1 MAG TPA: hypothetical protein [Caudoviricetes sp.]DAS55766.1 MAG TPA: hypothetical protein [Caudoviricetes sp.]DAT07887.1 MAG TPA: hypothetical protein [Caudoviricetes sp.]